ncbi:Calx-beta domain-containing protein [Mycolicibacterium iranicum]|uniref:Calx-beta domain-containing protein n=1 Tax=Mycolicibacterium iranicum TaxID=912594 RepID=UPI00288A3D98|nr:hypothetical protein [Mycolicibacterium iranicum]
MTFLPGETRKTISVVVFGDRLLEGTESFVVTLSSPTGATLSDATGTGTIPTGRSSRPRSGTDAPGGRRRTADAARQRRYRGSAPGSVER